MTQSPTVSRDLVRAVLEARDNRHNETHAALVAMFQALSAELIEAGTLSADALAGRLKHVQRTVTNGAHGEAARDLLDHVVQWLQSLDGELPVPHPSRWVAPPPPVLRDGETD